MVGYHTNKILLQYVCKFIEKVHYKKSITLFKPIQSWKKDQSPFMANIDFNKRNTKNTDNQPLLDDLLYKERFSVERTEA